ncbi:MAG: hypothetical protein KIT24_12310 [Phycisphaeraceae bacterium]|nr:hypothetical protein [Phycisphaeraceae bacterium]
MPVRKSGFTLIDTAATVAAAGICIAVAGVTAGMSANPRETARMIKDASQLRQMSMAFLVWATDNRDMYPMPSRIDVADDTVAEKETAKNTTAAIYSLLIFNGLLTAQEVVSPLENNPNIKPMTTFQANAPKAAVNPEKALWDPAFSIDFRGDKIGHASYAHQQPSQERSKRWRASYDSLNVVLSSRGPEVRQVDANADGNYDVVLADPNSRTLDVFTGRRKGAWSGHFGFGDGRVTFSERLIAPAEREGGFIVRSAVTDEFSSVRAGKRILDFPLFDEADPADNNYVGMFIKAGDKRADFSAIWD